MPLSAAMQQACAAPVPLVLQLVHCTLHVTACQNVFVLPSGVYMLSHTSLGVAALCHQAGKTATEVRVHPVGKR